MRTSFINTWYMSCFGDIRSLKLNVFFTNIILLTWIFFPWPLGWFINVFMQDFSKEATKQKVITDYKVRKDHMMPVYNLIN